MDTAPDITELRRQMLRFAILQLRDQASAEDAVQEAWAAVLSGRQQFEQRAQLKTWVFGILKNKIADIIRERTRMPVASVIVEEIPDDAFDALFDNQGFWQEDARPASWGDPESSFTSQQFWQIFEICLTRLPENTARVFMMREMLGFEVAEICKELGVTATNCWVILHRARMGLRLCLEERWFNNEGSEC